ncbi:MAG: hypothetical protein MZV63_18190 [Marinilabiliales bacterium]|nr:hypothetical protein [Marinilabiliales bacterium]
MLSASARVTDSLVGHQAPRLRARRRCRWPRCVEALDADFDGPGAAAPAPAQQDAQATATTTTAPTRSCARVFDTLLRGDRRPPEHQGRRLPPRDAAHHLPRLLRRVCRARRPTAARRGSPLSEGISPVQGADRHGPTAVIKSRREDGPRQDRRHAAQHEVHAGAARRRGRHRQARRSLVRDLLQAGRPPHPVQRGRRRHAARRPRRNPDEHRDLHRPRGRLQRLLLRPVRGAAGRDHRTDGAQGVLGHTRPTMNQLGLGTRSLRPGPLLRRAPAGRLPDVSHRRAVPGADGLGRRVRDGAASRPRRPRPPRRRGAGGHGHHADGPLHHRRPGHHRAGHAGGGNHAAGPADAGGQSRLADAARAGGVVRGPAQERAHSPARRSDARRWSTRFRPSPRSSPAAPARSCRTSRASCSSCS